MNINDIQRASALNSRLKRDLKTARKVASAFGLDLDAYLNYINDLARIEHKKTKR